MARRVEWTEKGAISDPSRFNRGEFTYARRLPAITLSERVTQGGVTFGPFVLFTYYDGPQRRRGLVSYIKASDTWYRFDIKPQPYTIQWYTDICGNTAGKWCGHIKNPAELEKQAKILRADVIKNWLAERRQTKEQTDDPFGAIAAQKQAGAEGAGVVGGAADKARQEIAKRPWLIPAAIVGGVAAWRFLR
jgi:hypothetical protein